MSSTHTLSLFGDPSASAVAANVLAAARALATHLARSRSLDRRLVAAVMTTAFGASDADGAWAWRDAYDAIEAATVLQIRRLAPQVGRLEDAPAEITALLAAVSALGLTHTRRSEEQVALDQFSTLPQLAALVVLAAQVRPGDRVLEPSAGTGLLAAVAEACGGVLALNEIAPGRADLLDGLFPAADRTRHDGRHIHDLSVGAGAFDVVVSNPPFSNLADHLGASLKALADDGRLAAIVPLTALTDGALLHRLSEVGVVVGRIALPSGAFAKHGTSVETGLLVVDRSHAGADPAPLVSADDLEAAAKTIAALPSRVGARPRARIQVSLEALLAPRERGLALPPGRLAFLAGATPMAYEVRAWGGEGRDVGLYQTHALARIVLPDARPHPSGSRTRGPARAPCGAASSQAASGGGRRLAACRTVVRAREGQVGGRAFRCDDRCAVRPDGDHPVREGRPVPLALWLFRRGGLRPVRPSGGARRLLRGARRGGLSEAVLFGREPAENGGLRLRPASACSTTAWPSSRPRAVMALPWLSARRRRMASSSEEGRGHAPTQRLPILTRHPGRQRLRRFPPRPARGGPLR